MSLRYLFYALVLSLKRDSCIWRIACVLPLLRPACITRLQLCAAAHALCANFCELLCHALLVPCYEMCAVLHYVLCFVLCDVYVVYVGRQHLSVCHPRYIAVSAGPSNKIFDANPCKPVCVNIRRESVQTCLC